MPTSNNRTYHNLYSCAWSRRRGARRSWTPFLRRSCDRCWNCWNWGCPCRLHGSCTTRPCSISIRHKLLRKGNIKFSFFFKIIIVYPPPIQSLMKYLLNSHRQVNWVPIWLAPNWSDCFWFRKSIRDRCVCACYSNRRRLPSLQQFHSHRPSDSSTLDCQNDADLSPTYTRTKWLQLFCLFSLFFLLIKKTRARKRKIIKPANPKKINFKPLKRTTHSK